MKHILLLLSSWLVLGFMAEAHAQNLLVNGSFEEDRGGKSLVTTTNPSGAFVDEWSVVIKATQEGTAEIAENEAVSGNKSLYVNLVSITARYNFYLAQEVQDVEPGKYTFSIWLKSDKEGEPFRLDVLEQGTEMKKQPFTTTTGWAKYDVLVDLSDRTENVPLLCLAVRFNCIANGNVKTDNLPVSYWVDDTSFSPLALTPAGLVNGDFESLVTGTSIKYNSDAAGSITDTWKLIVKNTSAGDALAVDDTEVYAGFKSLKVDLTDISARFHFFLAQEIANPALKRYKLSVYLKANKADIPFRIDFMDVPTGNTNGGTEISKHPFVTTVGWTKYECELDLSDRISSPDFLRLAIRFNCLNGGTIQNEPVTYWLDNIALEEATTSSIGGQLAEQENTLAYSTGNKIYFSGLEEAAKVSLYNTVGALILTDTVLPGGNVEVNRPGCYLVRIQQGNEVKTYKLMVAAQ